MEEYGAWLGMEVWAANSDCDDGDTSHQQRQKGKHHHLLWIAREALKAPLPSNWKLCQTPDGEAFYFNFKTMESIWEHPSDAAFKTKFATFAAASEKRSNRPIGAVANSPDEKARLESVLQHVLKLGISSEGSTPPRSCRRVTQMEGGNNINGLEPMDLPPDEASPAPRTRPIDRFANAVAIVVERCISFQEFMDRNSDRLEKYSRKRAKTGAASYQRNKERFRVFRANSPYAWTFSVIFCATLVLAATFFSLLPDDSGRRSRGLDTV